MEWIDIKNEKPEFDTKVLVFRSWVSRDKKKSEEIITTIEVGYLTDVITTRNGEQTEWHIDDQDQVSDVTYWAKLPEPPKP